MSTLSNQSLLEIKNIIAEISLQAAKVIMQNKNSTIKIKEDDTPVTIADEESDKLINNLLLKNFPNIPIVSEEREYPKNAIGNNLHWIIDPLDGTKSFIEGNEDFCVCIALALNQKPIIGCIAHPPSEKIWVGGINIGSSTSFFHSSKVEFIFFINSYEDCLAWSASRIPFWVVSSAPGCDIIDVRGRQNSLIF